MILRMAIAAAGMSTLVAAGLTERHHHLWLGALMAVLGVCATVIAGKGSALHAES